MIKSYKIVLTLLVMLGLSSAKEALTSKYLDLAPSKAATYDYYSEACLYYPGPHLRVGVAPSKAEGKSLKFGLGIGSVFKDLLLSAEIGFKENVFQDAFYAVTFRIPYIFGDYRLPFAYSNSSYLLTHIDLQLGYQLAAKTYIFASSAVPVIPLFYGLTPFFTNIGVGVKF